MRHYACRLACGFATLALVSTVSIAQEKKPADAEKPAAEKINYTDHIAPIIRAKCGTCHSAGEAKGGLVLDNYGATMTGGASGAVVEPGDVDGSRLWALVAHKEQPYMPPKDGKLADDQLALINKWIVGGALENKNSVVKVKAKPTLTLTKTDNAADKPAGPPPMPENLPTEPLTVSARGNVVTAVAASPWAPVVAVAGHKQVLLYGMDDFALIGVLPFPEGSINVLRFSRNGTLLLAAGGRGGQSGKAVAFDVKTGKRVFESGNEPDAVLAADISPDHTLVAVGGPKKLVHVYSTSDGDLEYELKKHTDWVTALEFSPDGTKLATADRSNGLIVWEADTGREVYVLNGHTAMINAVSWRSDSKMLATASEDGTVRQWEMLEGKQFKSTNAHGNGAASVQFLRDGRLVSTGRDKTTKLWDANGNQVRAFPNLADLGLRVTFSETNGYVIAGDWTGTLKVWNAADGVEKAALVTNPQPLAARLDDMKKSAIAAKAAADSTAAQYASLKKAADEKQAAANAAKSAADAAQSAVTAAAAVKAAADKLVAVRNDALQAAKTLSPGEVKAAVETATAEKTSAEKTAADAAAKLKSLTDQAAAIKKAADKAVADAVMSPDAQKALTAAEAAAKQAAETAAAKQSALQRLTTDTSRPATQVATPSK